MPGDGAEAQQQTLGQQIAALRRQKGLTQLDLANASGIQQSEISRIEGGRANSTRQTLDRLTQALGAPLELGGSPGGASSPYATGGGGVHFEHLMQARYLAALLAGSTPAPVWERSRLVEARFQQRGAGASFDDLILVARDVTGQERLVEVAARHRPRFSASDKKLVALLAEALDGFRTHQAEFKGDMRRLCIVVDRRTASCEQVQAITELARCSAPGSLMEAIETARSQAERAVAARLRKALAQAAKGAGQEPVSDDEVARLLASVHVVALDIEQPGGVDRVAAIDLLTGELDGRERRVAADVWERLINLAADWDAMGARVDEAALRRALRPDFVLARSDRHHVGWSRLLRLSEQAESAIHPSLPGGFALERADVRSRILEALGGQSPVLVVGEPGVGKSVAVKGAAPALGGDLLLLSLRDLPPTVLELEAVLGASVSDILAGAKGVGRPLLVLDAAEAVQEGREAIVRELLAAAHSRAGWQVCLVSRREGASKLRDIASRMAPELPLSTYEVPGLGDAELELVSRRFPQLARLLAHARARWLMRRPFYMDLVLRREMHDALGRERLSEADLLRLFWSETIELGGRMGDPRGSPAGRSLAMLAIARGHLRGRLDDVALAEPAALSGLQADGVLRPREGGVAAEFAHDVVRDFAVAQVLLVATDVGAPLIEASAPRWALRASRIAAQAVLAREPGPGRLGRLTELRTAFRRVAASHGERWGEVAWEGLLTVDDAQEALVDVWPELMTDDGAGVEQILLVLERRFMSSDGRAEMAVWEPALELFLSHAAEMPARVVAAMKKAITALLESSARRLVLGRSGDGAADDAVSGDVVELARAFLLGRLEPRRGNEQILRALALLGAGITTEVEAAFRETAEHRPGDLGAVVEDALCSRMLTDHTPDLLLELAEAYYIDTRNPRAWGGSPMDDGIRRHRQGHIGFPFANWWFGPFYLLLRIRPVAAIAFINRMLDHAARARLKALSELQAGGSASKEEDGVTVAVLDIGERRYRGDGHVYRWYRGTGVGPYACMSALLAVERFVNELLAGKMAVAAIGRWLLRDSHSLAMLGLWVGLLERRVDEVQSELDPLLATPEIWELEAERVTSDQAGYRAHEPGESDREERRGWWLGQVAAWLVLHADGERREELRRVGERLIARDPSSAVLKNWASQLDVGTYHLERVPEGILIQQRPPDDVAEQLEEGSAERADFVRIHNLAFRHGRDRGGQPAADRGTLREDVAAARELAERHPAAAGGLLVDAVAATAAAALEAQLEGAVDMPDEDLRWCVQAVVELAERAPQRSSEYGVIAEERWEMGWDRSAARGIALLAAEHPEDERVMSALAAVAGSPYEETQHILATALERFWAVPCRSAAGAKAGRGRARCIHERGFEALEAMVARLRLGPWDNATQRRPRVVFAKPVLKSIAASKGDDVAFHEMAGAARALDVCARSRSCVAERAAELLHELVELHARGWLRWGRRGEYVDTRGPAGVHVVAAGRVLDGDGALHERLAELYRADPPLLAAWAESLPEAAVDQERQRTLTEMWPRLMDSMMSVLEAKTERRSYRDNEALLESLIPMPPSGIEVHRWPTCNDLDSRIRALIGSKWDPRVLANRLIWFLSGQPVAAQLDRGLDWFLEIVDGAEVDVAGRTRLGRWLRTVRDEHLAPLSSEDRARWQRLVDALAAAGDQACVRLQQEEE